MFAKSLFRLSHSIWKHWSVWNESLDSFESFPIRFILQNESSWNQTHPLSHFLTKKLSNFEYQKICWPIPDKMPELILTSLQRPWGYYRTNITVGRPPLPGGWDTKDGATLPGSHCLDYYAMLCFIKDCSMFSIICLEISPTWMYDLRYYIIFYTL